MDRIFKGIWIPAEIWEDTALTWNEKIVLMEIDSFTASGKDCFISDEYIGKLIGVSTRTASTIVSKLIRMGYVKKTRSDGRHRYLESAIIASQICKICGADTQNLRTTYNKITNTNLQKKEEIYKEERFRKPSLEEVSEYCLERRNGIDPQAFLDFYESKGWKVGNTPMKDWRAAIRTWESKRKTQPPTPTSARPLPPSQESLSDYYRKLMDELKLNPDANFLDTPDEQ